MDNVPHPSELSPPPKRPYHAPRFHDLGSVAEQTQMNPNSGNADGGSTPPNVYVS
ncbi:MAG TPA: hypothetical protein VHF89_20275 [Solirubrobacteraceae bacterium]|nr:hypothetical protein [Solirubrobacteraceae bacterium]